MFNNINEQGIGKYINLKRFGLSTFALKVIALLTMVCDHVAIGFFDEHTRAYLILRSIGRISFPIFCFVLVEGFFYTHNRLEYAIRLGIFALLSEIPYDVFLSGTWDLQYQNVLFTLFIGFLVIWGMDAVAMFRIRYPEKLLKTVGAGRLNTVMEILVVIVGVGSAYLLKTSYTYAGVMLILCYYAFHKYHLGRLLSNLIFNFGMFGVSVQWWGALSAIPIAFYNEKPGRKTGKYFFYCFYPMHLMGLVMIKKVLG